MKMHDINPQQEDVILLIHPMFATAELMQELLAKPMGNQYRYLIPDLSGHGEAADRPYESAGREAAEIWYYLQDHQISSLRLAFGASLGGAVLMELLQKSGVTVERLFFEGASFFENAGWLNTLMKRVMLAKHRKAKAHPDIAVTKMSQLYGQQAGRIMARQIVSFQESSIEHIMWDCSHIRLPQLTARQQQNCVFAYGEKDGDLKTAQKIEGKKYPAAKLVVWPGMGHCMKMTEAPDQYARMLLDHLNGSAPR